MTTEYILPLSPEEALRRLVPQDIFSKDALSSISNMLDEDVREFDEGERMMVQGEPGRELFLIAKGRARVTQSAFGIGEPRTLAYVKEGDVVGERALIKNEPRIATVTATEPVIAYVLTREHLIRIGARWPGLEYQLRQIVEIRDAQNAQR